MVRDCFPTARAQYRQSPESVGKSKAEKVLPAEAVQPAPAVSGSGWRWSGLPLASRIVLILLVVSQIPLLLLILNNAFLDFDVSSGAYLMMHVIERVRTGASVYVPTAPGQCSPNYTPLYFWVSGWLCKLFGSSMVWPRLVSIVSTLVFAWITGLFVWRRTERNLVLSVAAPCFVLSSCAYVGPWVFDIQVNAMQGALVLLGFFLLLAELTPARVVWAALVMSLAVLTKHTALAYLVAAGALVYLRAPRLGALYGAVAAGFLVVVGWWLNVTSHGYFLRNVLGAGDAPWLVQRLWTEVFFPDLLGRYGLMTVLMMFPVLATRRRTLLGFALKPEYVMCAAGIAVTCIAQPKYGSGPLHALVAYAGISVCGAIGLHHLSRMLPSWLSDRLLAWVVVLQLIILLISGVPTYSTLLVDEVDRAMYKQVADVFRSGRTAFYYWSYLPTLFGQPESGQYGDETMKWKDGRTDYSATPASIYEPFVREEYDYVILPVFADQRDPSVQAVLAHYKAVSRLPGHPRGTVGGNFRYEKVVFKANRLMPNQPSTPADTRVNVGPFAP